MRTVMQIVAEGNRSQAEGELQAEECLLQALTCYTFTYPGFLSDDAAQKMKKPWDELSDVLFNEKRAGGLSSNLALFNRAVYAVRDHWSADTWRVVRGMEETWATAKAGTPTGHLRKLHALNELITSMVAFIGLNRESISREQGWIMLDTGRKIEQSLLLITMLRATLVYRFDDPVAYELQEALLTSNESLVNYRYKYRAHLQLPLVLDLMVFDPNNPRSLVYQLDRLKAYLSNLPKTGASHQLQEHERLILEAYTLLKLSDKDQLSLPGGIENSALDTFLAKMYALLLALPDVISKTYFKHAQAQTQLFATDKKG